MLTFSPSLAALLADDATKTQWATTLKDALGLTRRVRCFRDAADAAPDPATTGTEFLNMAATGALTIVGSRIIGLGVTSDQTIQLAADLNTGTSVLRIEGGGHWVQGTIGLPLSGKDFIMSANPTTATGVGFATSAGVDAPSLLDSGTGPLAPANGPKTPYSIILQDWSSGSAVVAGERLFDTRTPNMVFDDAEMAEVIGDVRITQFSSAIPFYEFDFGATLFGINEVVTIDGQEPAYEVLCGFTPNADNWSGYPRFSGVNDSVTKTHMPAFKAVLMAFDGSILHTFQMHDGFAINAPEIEQRQKDHANYPPRAMFNCAQLLPWRSTRLKLNTYANKYFNGMEDDILRPTLTRQKVSSNPAYPLFDFRSQKDSMFHWFAAPKRGVAGNAAGRESNITYDPLLYSVLTESGPYGDAQVGLANAFGWGYDPGNNGLHDVYTGPGGIRHDRSPIPHVVALHMTNPNFIRPHRNDPIGEMLEANNHNQFNIAVHYLANAATFETISFDEVMQGKWGHGKTYYGGLTSYVSGGTAYTVPAFAVPNGAGIQNALPWGGAKTDATGNMFWDGHAIDYFHNYTVSGYGAMLYSSPMHAYAQKHRFITSVMCQLGEAKLGSIDRRGRFFTRAHAWVYLHYAVSWKVAYSHPTLGMSRAAIEDRFQADLEDLYDGIYTAVVLQNAQDPYSQCLRNLGTVIDWKSATGTWDHKSAGMTYYMYGALLLMRQTGLWHVMRTKSAKCEAVLLFIIKCMDKYAVDWMLDTEGRKESYLSDSELIKTNKASETTAIVYANWAEYAALQLGPKTGQEDWVTRADGTLYKQDTTQHFRAAYVRMRKHFFPDVPCERANGIDLADAMYQAGYDKRAAYLASQYAANASAFTLRASDWGDRYAGHGLPKAPPAGQLGEY